MPQDFIAFFIIADEHSVETVTGGIGFVARLRFFLLTRLCVFSFFDF